MPDNVLSTPSVPGAFQPPEDRPVGQFPPVAYELGGIALNDSSQGLQYQVWVFEITNYDPVMGGDGVSVRPEGGGAPVVFYTGAGITEVSGAFDANMNPTIAFVEAGVAKLRWYDSSLPGYAVTVFPGYISPRLALDDKREGTGSNRDILFFYLRPGGSLNHRIQRDRYGVEYQLTTDDPRRVALGRVGMNDRVRVQVEILTLCEPIPEDGWGTCAGAPLPEWAS